MKFKSEQTAQKLRGGYYTPTEIAEYAAGFVAEAKPKSILEPSCGDGVFIEALHTLGQSKATELKCFELFDEEADKAKAKAEALGFNKANIKNGDFLGWAAEQVEAQNQLFDGVIGNPPFIRYQFLDGSFQRDSERIFHALGLKFTKHTNAWVPFVIACISMLRPGGRFAMVIPSEIIHVMHAQSLRTYLGEVCKQLLIIDPEEIWFEDTLQGVVILLAEKKAKIQHDTKGVAIVGVKGNHFLKSSHSELFKKARFINGKTVEGKWTKALLNPSELALIDRLLESDDVFRFSEIASVDVGIVTGANKFFLVDDATVDEFSLRKYSHPMFGRSEHCPGVIYGEKQHAANAESGLPTNFIYIQGEVEKLPKGVREYIRHGEQQELHSRYKCSIRKPWYTVPSVYSTEIGMLKRAHDTPRLIFNSCDAYTTDTAYRISSNKINAKKLVYCFLNPLTALSAELEGRHYGGGVLELVPSEIEKLIVPVPGELRPRLAELDKLIRTHSVVEVLERQAKHIFSYLGLSDLEQNQLLNAWFRLKNRRQRK